VVGAVVLVETAALEVVVTGAVVVEPWCSSCQVGPEVLDAQALGQQVAMRWARGGTSSGSTKTVSSKSSASTV